MHPVAFLYGVSYAEAKDYCYTEVNTNLLSIWIGLIHVVFVPNQSSTMTF